MKIFCQNEAGSVTISTITERQQILERLRERIASFAASHYRRESAEDIAQEALMVLHQKYSHVEDAAELAALGLQIARFKIKSAVRKMIRRGENLTVDPDEIALADPGPNPGEAVARKLMIEKLREAIGKLGDRCRRLFRYKLEGRSFPEIQRLFEADSINTIYTWDHRCREQLKREMGGWEIEK